MWVALAIVIIAIIVAVEMRPTVANPRSGQKGTVPDVKDGKRVIRIYGTIWIDDPIQLAMKETGQIPIRKSA